MITEKRFQMLLSATPEQLSKVDDVLEGRAAGEAVDTRLLTLTEAAEWLNCSRMSVHRMCAEKRLPCIETRAGRRRVPAAALQALVRKAVAHG